MVEINLLPWRDNKYRYERRSIYFLCVSGTVLSVLLMLVLHGVVAYEVTHQEGRLNDLRSQSSLRKSQNVAVPVADASGIPLTSIFKNIGKTAHAGMCYQRITQDENRVHLLGFSRSLQAVMAAWRQLARVRELSSLRVKEIKPGISGGYQFVLELPAHIDREEW